MTSSTIKVFYGFAVFLSCLSICSADCEDLNKVKGNCDVCLQETGLPASSKVKCFNVVSDSHLCNYRNATPTELGVQIQPNHFQLPNSYFTASSNNNKAHYARIGSDKVWCAADANSWLEVDLGAEINVERIELETLNDNQQFTLSYTTISNARMDYNTTLGPLFTSNKTKICHYAFLPNATTVRFNLTAKGCIRVAIYGDPPQGRMANPTELGVKVHDGIGTFYRIPDKNFKASSNEDSAKYARVGLPSDKVWCAASNDTNPWLDIELGDSAKIVERIEVQGNPEQPNWEQKFSLSYKITSNSKLFQYKNGKIFTSTMDRATFLVSFTENPDVIRIIANSTTPCFRVALYGEPKVGPIVEVVQGTAPVITVQPTARLLGRESISTTDFLRGYLLWAIFLAVFVFLLVFSLTFLFSWCCRRPREFPSKSRQYRADMQRNYTPSWRTIDAKAEKGYIATQEVQEVKIAFSDEYIPPDLQKEKVDPNDEKYYRHRIFAFRGWDAKEIPRIVEPAVSNSAAHM